MRSPEGAALVGVLSTLCMPCPPCPPSRGTARRPVAGATRACSGECCACIGKAGILGAAVAEVSVPVGARRWAQGGSNSPADMSACGSGSAVSAYLAGAAVQGDLWLARQVERRQPRLGQLQGSWQMEKAKRHYYMVGANGSLHCTHGSTEWRPECSFMESRGPRDEDCIAHSAVELHARRPAGTGIHSLHPPPPPPAAGSSSPLPRQTTAHLARARAAPPEPPCS